METAGTTKKCPKCGNSFQCFGDDDCWCENYQILQKDFLQIARQFSDCICPDCLKGYISE